jgi:hypothetical protein
MKSEEWKSYRTRFLVNAKQLNSALSFVDHLGRQHRGCKGDYLVESSDGVISIAPRRVFEDIYVPMPQPQGADKVEPLAAAERPIRKEAAGGHAINLQAFEPLDDQATQQRKLPQPCRDRCSSGSRLGLM